MHRYSDVHLFFFLPLFPPHHSSSSSAQIEARGGDGIKVDNPRFDPTQPISKDNERLLPDYATVSGILLGVVCAYLLLVIVVGREEHGAHFEKEVVAGATVDPHAVPQPVVEEYHRAKAVITPDGEKVSDEEEIEHVGDKNLAPAVDALPPTPELDDEKDDSIQKAY